MSNQIYWEIWKGNQCYLRSPIPNCGYPDYILKSMRNRGYRLVKKEVNNDQKKGD